MMENKREKILLMCLSFLVILSILAVAGLWPPVSGDNRDVIDNERNISGSVNLSARINETAASVTNITWNFVNLSVNPGRVIFNITHFNTSVDQVQFDANDSSTAGSFDTSVINDGVYNITIVAINATGSSATNFSAISNITIDNTLPNVSSFSVNKSGTFTIATSNASFNATVKDLFNGFKPDRNPAISQVLLQFDNATGVAFNVSAVNTSGVWQVDYNVSSLRGGLHTVTVIANDSADNFNRTETLTFTVNTAPNVTVISSPQGANHTASSGGEILFNVSARNATTFFSVSNVIFQFDNATGNDFNVTASNDLTLPYAKYWNITYNVSTLEEGNHTVTIFANDTNANLNKTVTITFNVDKTAPSISVTCDPDSVEQSAAAPTCTCTATDATGNQTGVQTKTFEPDPSTAETGTITTKICQGIDYAGNSASATGTFTVTAVTSSGGGAGGSGGGSSSSATGQFAKTVWTSIFAGETATVEVDNGEVGVTEISFDVTDDIYGAWVSVNKKDSFPSSVTAFARAEYKKLEISKGPALKEGTFENAKVRFKVLKTWLAENQLEKGSVAMFHYDEDSDEWTELSTVVGEDDGTFVHYTSETPDFSYFLIGEREGAPLPEAETAPAEEEAPAAPTPTETAPTPTPTGEPSGAPAWPWALVALVVIGAAVAYYLMKKR